MIRILPPLAGVLLAADGLPDGAGAVLSPPPPHPARVIAEVIRPSVAMPKCRLCTVVDPHKFRDLIGDCPWELTSDFLSVSAGHQIYAE